MSEGQAGDVGRVATDADAPVALLSVSIKHGDGESPGRIVNLAESAFFLATDIKAQPGCWVGVRLIVEGEPCDARGKVVWQADNGIGVRLIRVQERFREFVRELAAAGGSASTVLDSVDEAGVMIGR